MVEPMMTSVLQSRCKSALHTIWSVWSGGACNAVILCISPFNDLKLADLFDSINYISIFSILCCSCGVVNMEKTSKDTGSEIMWTFLCYTESILPGWQRTATLTYTTNWP